MVDIIRESFETDGNGTRYTTSILEFTDGAGDFFTRTDGADIGSFYEVTGQTGTSWFAAMDIDGEGAAATQTLTFAGIDIAGFTNLGLSIDLAEDDDRTNQDWDPSDELVVEARIDGGAYANVLAVQADIASGFNGTPRIDADFDGVGEGAEITSAFQTFTAGIAGTGSTLDLRVTFTLNSGDEDISLDEIAVTGTPSGPTVPTLTIADVSGSEDDGAITVTVSLDEAVAGGFTVDASTADGTATTAGTDYTAAAGRTLLFMGTAGETQTFTVAPTADAAFEPDETLTVSLSNLAATTESVDITDTATVTILNDDPRPVTLISDIQGNEAEQVAGNFGLGDASPLEGQTVTVEAVVVGDFQDGAAGTSGDLNGFYLQEEDADADGDAGSSEGIFVFDGSNPAVDVNVGDTVRVTGTVGEFFGQTQLGSISDVTIVSQGNALPTATVLTADPVTGAFGATTTNSGGALVLDLESVEGMRVTTTETLTVSDLFGYGRFGEVGVNSGGRIPVFTQVNEPDVAGYTAFQQTTTARTLIVDDGTTAQNPAALPLTDYDAGEVLRSGDQITELTGVVRYGTASGRFGEEAFRINPTEAPTVVNANPRPLDAPDVGGALTIASFNVLNFFTTLDQGGNRTATGQGPRGADDAAEYQRQLDKLVAAIGEIDADVLGLIEIENEFGTDQNGDGQVAIEALVAALNAEAGAGTYAAVDPGVGTIGTDAIAVGFIYKPAAVTPTGAAAIADSTTAPGFDDTVQRPTLVQSFTEVGTGETFTAAVNHFKSKGSVVNGENGTGDGQANNNPTRTAAAEAVVDFLATDPTGVGSDNVIILGDLNAYAKEDPIVAVEEGADDVAGTGDDFTDLVGAFSTAGEGFDYTFGFPVSFDDAPLPQAFGTLDYALGNVSFTGQVTGAAVWHTNADEPTILDYNTNFKTLDPYAPDAFRASDHDAVLVGLTLDANVEVMAAGAVAGRFGTFQAADAAAGAGEVIIVRDAAALGDIGAATVTTDGLLVVANGPFAADLTLANNGTLRLAGNAAIDVTGTNGADAVVGNAGANAIAGGAGNDVINARRGDDVLDGGAGNDVLIGGAGGDVLIGGAGRDTAFYATAGAGPVDINLADTARNAGDAAGDSYSSIEVFRLTGGDDNFTGSDAGEAVLGGAGDDRLNGAGGSDALYGGAGDDRLFGFEGNDVFVGGAGADAFDGGAGRDTAFYGFAGGSVRVDMRVPERGAGEAAGDTFDGIEVFRLTGGNDAFIGDGSASTVVAGGGNDFLFGGEGADGLVGGAGDDRIRGGTGNDTLVGGAGLDAFVLGAGFGRDYVADFTRGQDVIEVRADTGMTSFDDLLVMQVGANARIAVDTNRDGIADGTDRVTLAGVDAADLTADDFAFVTLS